VSDDDELGWGELRGLGGARARLRSVRPGKCPRRVVENERREEEMLGVVLRRGGHFI